MSIKTLPSYSGLYKAIKKCKKEGGEEAAIENHVNQKLHYNVLLFSAKYALWEMQRDIRYAPCPQVACSLKEEVKHVHVKT